MKKTLFIILTVSVLALSLTLASCSNDTGSKGTGPTVTAAAAADSTERPATADTAAEAASAPAPTAAAVPKATTAESTEQQTGHETSPAATAPGETAAKPTSNPEAAYSAPSFTITMKNLSTGKTYSAACSSSKERAGIVSGYFCITGGKYVIEISEYSDNGAAVVPEATGSYNDPAGVNERKYIRVDYTPETGKIEVEEQQTGLAK